MSRPRPVPHPPARPVPRPPARPLSPQDLLQAADRLLGTSAEAAGGVWPRAGALLLRHALEEALRRYWRRVQPRLERCPTHAQTLCLAAYADPDVARRWSSTWLALSRACHYHGYELSPAPAELRAWRNEVAAVLAAMPDRA